MSRVGCGVAHLSILFIGMSAIAFGDGKGIATLTQQSTQTDYDDSSVVFFRLADDIDQDGVFGSIPIVVLVPDGTGGFVANVGGLHDFDDLHQFNVSFDSISYADLPNSGAIDVANVIWLSDDTDGAQQESYLVPWRAAEALRHDWQFTGIGRRACVANGRIFGGRRRCGSRSIAD